MPPPSTKFIRDALTDAFDADHPAATILLARKLLEAEPEDAMAWTRLGKMLGDLANYGEAERALETALKFSTKSNRYIVYSYLGHACRWRGDYEGAAKWYRMVSDLKPDDTCGYVFLGAALARQGKLAEAEEVQRSATRCKEGCIDEAYHNLGLVLRGQGRLDEACKCFEKAIELDPKFDDAKEALADVRAAISYQKLFE
jgi:tetratricopeptide (TPR) repeat protein